MLISRRELEQVMERNGQDSHVLSVYLDIDQSRAANLNRGFEPALREMLRRVSAHLHTEEERREFEADAERATQFVSRYVPHGRTLVLFCDASKDFLWERDLRIALSSDARWDVSPNTKPLLEALDEYERYCVVLVNKQEARLLTVFLGEIEEHFEVTAVGKIKHFRSAAKDNRVSPSNIQHKIDEHWSRHVKEVAERAERLVADRDCNRLILAGPVEVTSELEKVLPKRLQSMTVAAIPLSMDASEQDVLDQTLRIEAGAERADEDRIVDDLITGAAKRNHAVLGLAATLEAVHEGRIRKLVYAERLAFAGAQCTNCNALTAGETGACPYCGSAVRPIDDVMERIAERVVDSGGKTEYVRAAAADRLRQAGSIGAFLRF